MAHCLVSNGRGRIMTQKESKGLLAIWTDIEKDYRPTLEEWHNCEHMADRVTLPGFHVGRRYNGIGQAPNYLMFYELSSSKTSLSKPYLYSLNHPTPRTKEALTYFRNTVRTIYRLLAGSGRKSPLEAPYLLVVRFNIEAEFEREVLRWYRKEYLPKVVKIRGVYRGRLYEADSGISNISTKERKIHGASAGQKRFLSLFEVESLDLFSSKAWRKAHSGAVRDKSVHQKILNPQEERYWIGFTLCAPRRTRGG